MNINHHTTLPFGRRHKMRAKWREAKSRFVNEVLDESRDKADQLAARVGIRTARCVDDDDDKFTPTRHLTPPPHHSSRPAASLLTRILYLICFCTDQLFFTCFVSLLTTTLYFIC